MNEPIVKEAPAEVAQRKKKGCIGLPKCNNPADRRFPLTPEAVAVLTRFGFEVKMQSGAADHIHYRDEAYLSAGAQIVDRPATLQADIVIHLAPLDIMDIRQLRRGALWLSLANLTRDHAADVIRELVDRRVINIAVDYIRDSAGNRPFGDIIDEINGRSAMTIAAGMLADPIHGKGILLGGIAGVIPCEVTIIGSCLAACAAARSAIGLGALVRLFDDDVYRLRTALRRLGDGVIGSSVHPQSLENALRSADVVIVTGSQSGELPLDGRLEAILKRRVLLFDLSENPGVAMPRTRLIDLGLEDPTLPDREARTRCYINTGSRVPRSAAMALSDTFITLLKQIADCENTAAMLPLNAGLRDAVLTYMGKAVNEQVAALAGLRFTDIRLLLSLS